MIRQRREALAGPLTDAIVSGWVAGAGSSLGLVAAFLDASVGKPPAEPPVIGTGAPGPEIEFPGLERAITQLAGRQLLSPEDFYAITASARQQAFTVSGDLGEATIAKLHEILAENFRGPVDREGFTEEARKQIASLPISDAHLEQVMRNNTNEAFSQGAEYVLEQPLVADEFPYRMAAPIRDTRTRPTHLAIETSGLDGTAVFHKDDPVWLTFRGPWDWNAFLPGTLVEGRPMIGLKSWYAGQVFEITSKSGRCLRVTSNHPVLTNGGIVPAHALCQGQHLIGYASAVDTAGGREKHKDRGPSRIEDVFCSLEKIGPRWSTCTRPGDLHGDAASGNGYVDVVGSYGEVADGCEAVIRKGSAEFGPPGFGGTPSGFHLSADGRLIRLDGRPFSFLGFGSAANVDLGIYQSTSDDAAVDAERVSNALFGFARNIAGDNGLRVQTHQGRSGSGFGEGADSDSGLRQGTLQSDIGDVTFVGKLFERCPEAVFFDEVVAVRQFGYSGHVYDLMADVGWIVANGFATVQCRCGWLALSVESAAALGVKSAQAALAAGVAPAVVFVPWPTLDGEPILPSPSWQRVPVPV